MSKTNQSGIGGSDISAVANCNPYKTAADVYARLVATVAPIEDNPRMALGRAMEGHIIDQYCLSHGFDPRDFQRLVEIQDSTQLWRRGELDALDRKRSIALDAKLVVSPRQFARWGEVGTDQVPDEYLLQAHWYMALAQVELFVIVAFIEGDMREYEIKRDREIETTLIDMGERFWVENVQKRIPPPLEGCAPETLRALFPRNSKPLREATLAEVEAFQNLAFARADKAAAAEREEIFKGQLQASIADAEGIQCPLGKITWKNNKDSQSIDWEAVALSLGAKPEIIKQHTITKPGNRVFLFKPAKEQ